jgi:hypothetical protein
MWIVSALVNGTQSILTRAVVEEEQPPSLEQARAAAETLPLAERLLRSIDAELRITLRCRTALVRAGGRRISRVRRVARPLRVSRKC